MTDFAHPDDIIRAAGQGKIFILVDDEKRENEGDLIVLADCVTPDAINFMATHGRGLVCLALAPEIVERLRLPMMTPYNEDNYRTAFTVSVDARHGITTGISAFDRALTVQRAIAPDAKPEDLVVPGHIFPLVAKANGVLERLGHTEAAVDVARLAGRTPAGVICEVMNDDGTMARLPDLMQYAKKHGLLIGKIADLVDYRRNKEASAA